jgi:hypothetical protein
MQSLALAASSKIIPRMSRESAIWSLDPEPAAALVGILGLLHAVRPVLWARLALSEH